MNRRGFLGSILALGAAPAIVRADSLMRIVVPQTGLLVPEMDIGSAVAAGRAAGANVGSTLLTPTLITREALRILHQQSLLIGRINQDWDAANVARSVQIKRPPRYTWTRK